VWGDNHGRIYGYDFSIEIQQLKTLKQI
jgi:hypothetical protein